MLLTSMVCLRCAFYAKKFLNRQGTQLGVWVNAWSSQKRRMATNPYAKHTIKAQKQNERSRRNIIISSCTLGVATLGHWFYPPATLLALPLVAYQSWPIFHDAWQTLTQKRQIHPTLLDSTVVIYSLIGASPLAVALNSWLVTLRNTQSSTIQLAQWENLSQQYQVAPVNKDGSVVEHFQQEQGQVSEATSAANATLKESYQHEATYPRLETPTTDTRQSVTFYVQSGEVIPIDGAIVKGTAWINEQNIRGECKPVTKTVGDTVFANSLVLIGDIEMQGETDATHTLAAQIAQTLTDVAKQETFVDQEHNKRNKQITKGILGLGAITALMAGPNQAIALLNSRPGYGFDSISSTYMLKLLQKACQHGLLAKTDRIFRRIQQIDTFVFDWRVLRSLPNAAETLHWLRSQKQQTIYLVGDAQLQTVDQQRLYAAAAKKIAAEYGARQFFLAPKVCDQIAIIEQLQSEGRMICYVGDGIRQGALMQRAELSISIPTASKLHSKSIVADAADVMILNEELQGISKLYELAAQMKQELSSTYLLTLIPGLIAITGAMLFKTDLITSVLLNNFGAFAAMNKIEK